MKIKRNNNKNRENIAIVGLGYVGLPLMLRFIKSDKFNVFGIDQDKKKIESLKIGKSYISYIHDKEIKVLKQKIK